MSTTEEVTATNKPSAPEIVDNQQSNFQLSWPPLEHVEELVRDDDWTRHKIPAVLRNVPDRLVLNRLLQDVMVWSLRRRGETQIVDSIAKDINSTLERAQDESSVLREGSQDALMPEACDTNQAAANAVGENASEPLVNNAGPLNESDDRPAVHETPPADTSDASTISSTTSRRISPLVSRLKQLRKDMTHKKSLRTKKNPRLTGENSEASVIQQPANGECISCFDEFPVIDLTALDCSHTYCKTCLREVVLNAMKTESAFPPKCCLTEIPLKTALSCLSAKQRAEYKDKSAEYAVSYPLNYQRSSVADFVLDTCWSPMVLS